MGLYLNSKKPHTIYQNVADSVYFVDKTALLEEILPLVEPEENGVVKADGRKKGGNKYICITRPRRFGKTVMASMIASFFGKGRDSRDVFEPLCIGRNAMFERHINKHEVIYITFSELPDQCKSYEAYISRVKQILLRDLKDRFEGAKLEDDMALWDAFNSIYELYEDVKFIFVLDEWDYIFNQKFSTTEDKMAYLRFLSNLLKDQPYVELAYMTGILPIAKYASGSELNMFYEYTMITEEKYSEYFGFTEDETDLLFQIYKSRTAAPEVTREGLKLWYDGYHTKSGGRVYNPRSVVAALTNNNLGNYWTSSGPYDEISYYIEHNTDAVRDDIALMVSGIPVAASVKEYAATSMNLTTREEILSAMVVYGFLSYEQGCVSIPNKELMDKFDDMLKKEQSLGYVHQLAKESERMLKATLAEDTNTMLEILEYAHNTEIPLLNYNNEAELTALINLIYLSARDCYRMEREDKAGTGYVDFIFYPETDRSADGIILELKVNHTAQEALRQIKDKKYLLKFEGHLGEKPRYTGRILGVGIAYNKETKIHDCKVEVLREAQTKKTSSFAL